MAWAAFSRMPRPKRWPLRLKASAQQPRSWPRWQWASPSGLCHAVVVSPLSGGRGWRIHGAPWLVFNDHHGVSCGLPVPDSDHQPARAADPVTADPATAGLAAAPAPVPPPRQGGWPLPVKILLAAVVLGFVWSPFLAMLVRLSHVNPALAPDAQPAGIPDLAPPLTPGGAPPADGRRSRVPSP